MHIAPPQSIDDLIVVIAIPHGEKSHIGNGILLSEDGYILTASHVINHPRFSEGFACGKMGEGYGLLHIPLDFPQLDIAVVKAAVPGRRVSSGVHLAQNSNYSPGTLLTHRSRTNGEPIYQKGIIMEPNNAGLKPHQFLITSFCEYGQSGSPYFNESGEIVGIAVRTKPLHSRGGFGIGAGIACLRHYIQRTIGTEPLPPFERLINQ